MNLAYRKILQKYPKKRKKLSSKIKIIFDREYKKNRQNIFSQLSESWLHYSISGRNSKETNHTLEIGAGTLNHLKYESKKNLKNYNIIEPKKFLFKKNNLKKNIKKIYNNYEKLPKNKFDRIISCAVLEHLDNLPRFLAKTGYSLKKDGYHSHSIPCEGYPIWHMAWNLISGIPFKIRTGLDFKEIQKYEHVNNYDEILELINFFYKKIKVKHSFPFFYSPYSSLYANFTFSKPKLKVINEFLKKLYE